MRTLCCLVLAVSVSGCSWLTFGLLGDDDGEIKVKGPSIGKVVSRLPELELVAAADVKPTRDEVMAAYNRVYGMMPTASDNHAVGKRLADLHMDQGQDLDIDGAVAPYQAAVDLYEKLLAEHEAREAAIVSQDVVENGASAPQKESQIDEILYQLARAADLAADGERTLHYLDRLIAEYPSSVYAPEAHFRRAEMRFSAEQFRDAAADYSYVVALGEETPYFRNATYMLGWAEFKRSRFDEGLAQFFNVVDNLLGATTEAPETEPDLKGSEAELLSDTFRVVTLALAYLDGPLTLADEMRRRDKPHWQYLAYEKLADDYFDKERFLDTVATWQTFIEHNTLDARAPAAHIGMIQTLMDAGFPSDVIPKKKEFVLRYGVYSEFWGVHDENARAHYMDTLHKYLSELSKLAHAEAQEADAREKPKVSDAERIELYLAAAQWYEELVVTFPEDPRTAEFLFLLGETYTEAEEHGRAVAALQRVVHEFPDYHLAHEAGYAAILGLSKLVASASPDELELWQRLKIDAQIEFALLFPGDARAPAVQTDAADTLFRLGEAGEAIQLAENLLAEWPDVDPALKKTALLIIGHGRFEADEFVAAESAYHTLLTMALTEDETSKVFERLLAAVYKQAEAAEAAGEVDLAVHHYLRVATLDAASPVGMASPLAAQGHFDAVAVLEGAERTAEAAALLAQFRTRYPQHELTAGIDLRLAGMYEKSQNWQAAAAEYVALSKQADDEEVRRQSLYRAAEIYLETNDVPNAIAYFRDYAHTYKKPWDLRLEAMDQMDQLYQRTGEEDKRRFWLRKIVALHREMGRQATERATYLAASAEYVFAEDEKLKFAAIRLTHPLKKSLKRKQSALKKTLKAYEKVASYNVSEYSAASTFEIGALYSGLSQAIMDSDRPKGLSELELEQYEILLEEQAFPFEEQAISLHQINVERAWAGTYDEWVKRSFAALRKLMPGRFDKPENEVSYATAIH